MALIRYLLDLVFSAWRDSKAGRQLKADTATTLLAEFRVLDVMLREVARGRGGSPAVRLVTPAMDRILSTPSVLDPQTVSEVGRLRVLVRTVRIYLDCRLSQRPKREWYWKRARVEAVLAAHVLADAVAALRREGGTTAGEWPASYEVREDQPLEAQLPPSPFETTADG